MKVALFFLTVTVTPTTEFLGTAVEMVDLRPVVLGERERTLEETILMTMYGRRGHGVRTGKAT